MEATASTKTAAAPTKTASTRIYAVREQSVDAAGKCTAKETRLVKASNPARALKHVVTPRFTAEVAEMDEVVKMVQDGTEIEVAATEE